MKAKRTGQWIGAACLLATAGLAGCKNGGASSSATTAANNTAALPADGAVPSADRWKVKASTTPFYHYGPQQLNGSDQDVAKDTRITMLSRSSGYSRVRLPSNEVGYVGTEDITPLDASEIAAEDAQKLAAAAAAAPPGALTGPMGSTVAPAAGGPRYTIPADAGRSESLPTADPGPTPKTPPPSIFRY